MTTALLDAVHVSGDWWGRLKGWRKMCLGLVAIVACALVGPPTASAADEGDRQLRTLVVLDVSGSMARDGGHGQSLLVGAKRAMSELAFSLPRSSQMGLRVYGSEHAEADKAVSCKDTELLLPLSPLRPEALIDAADGLEPTGDTPIGYALTQASGDFDNGGTERDVVVLISDGEDNCSQTPPCEVVKDLQMGGLEVRIETVGVALRADTKARQELQCIAAATNGKYYDAEDADSLSAALNRISAEAQGILAHGKSIQAPGNERDAQRIKPGAYRTSLAPGEVAWYSFRAKAGTQPRVLATIKGGNRLMLPREYRRCRSWRVELRNLAGEGRVYPPYGNSAIFDGVDYGTAGAATTAPLKQDSTGIDYPGTWKLQLALGRDEAGEAMECAELLEQRDYDVYFQLDYHGLEEGGGKEREDPSTAEPDETGAASPSASPHEPTAADKYDLPREATSGSALRATVLALMFAVGVGGLGALIYRIRRRRARGW